MLFRSDVTVAEVLKKAGYATALVGKWGLGEQGSDGAPNKKGFDEFYGVVNQTHAHNHFPAFLWRNGEKVALANVVQPVGEVPGAGYATRRVAYADDLCADDSLEFITRHRDRPFFPSSRSSLPTPTTSAPASSATATRCPTTAPTPTSRGRTRSRATPP